MEAGPAARLEVVNVAIPLPFSVPAPRVELPFLNVTAPVGTPVPGAVAVTVAENVTGWLYTDGLAEEVSATDVAAAFTTSGALLPLLLLHPLAPVKLAVMVWLATASVEVLNEAWPEPSTGTFAAHTVLPSVKVTVPTGTPPLEVVAEVKVTN